MVPEGTDVDGWTCLRQFPFSHDAPEVSPSPGASASPTPRAIARPSATPSASPCPSPSRRPDPKPNPTQDKMDDDEMYLDSAEVIED